MNKKPISRFRAALLAVIAIFLLLGCLLGCGGSSGGSENRPTTSTPREHIDPSTLPELTTPPATDQDPNAIGDPIVAGTAQWEMTVETGTAPIDAAFTVAGTDGNLIRFAPFQQNGSSFHALAMQNDDVSIMGMLAYDDLGVSLTGFGRDGNQVLPPIDLHRYYYGQYAAISAQGVSLGNWDMEIYIDFANIRNSYGLDLNTGEDIRIRFDRWQDREVYVVISDPNHDFHNTSLGFFGDDARTLAGGFVDETGMGLVIAEF